VRSTPARGWVCLGLQMTGMWHCCRMTTDPAASVPNPVQHRDTAVLIGILAILEGAIWAGSFDEQTTGRIADRFAEEGLLAGDYDQRDLRQALGDLNQRLRYAAGEYESPPESTPLPP
jgi:hypothetical protein